MFSGFCDVVFQMIVERKDRTIPPQHPFMVGVIIK